MKLTDIIELAKQGFTPGDIKELIALNTNETEVEPIAPEQTEKHIEPVESEQKPIVKTESDEPVIAEDDSINYKELFEKSQATIDRLNRIITSRNVQEPNTKTDEELLSDLVRSFM